MRQVFHPYQVWEGYLNGMYDQCKDGRENRVNASRSLLSDAPRLYEAMVRVTDEWVNETEQVLTDMSISHRSWLGQAACNIALGSKEDETREAWGLISEQQRKAANAAADRADRRWRHIREGGYAEQLSLDDLMEAV